MAIGAITAAPAAAATPFRAISVLGIKLALTLLADADRSLNGSGAPAAPRPPQPAVPLAAGLDFPALIAARFAAAPRPTRNGGSRSDQRSRKRD
jgi:hypothetical protein